MGEGAVGGEEASWERGAGKREGEGVVVLI